MDTKIVIVLAASVFVFCLLLFLFNFVYKYQKKTISFIKEKELLQAQFKEVLLQSQIEVQEATFSTLGKELHDNIGQLLSTAKLLLGITEMNLDTVPDTFITAKDTVGTAITELRALSKSLNKEWLEQFDLINNLTTEVNRINASNTIKLHLTCPEKLLIKPNKQIILFRIIQEAIQNSIKHAAAENIYIVLQEKQNELAIEIKDDGTGLNQHKLPEGVGMINMKNRAKLLEGSIEWQSRNKGCTVVITIPKESGE